MTDPALKTLDWVRVRAECSLKQMFLLLSEVVDSDVASIQKHQTRSAFEFKRLTDDRFVVNRRRDMGGIFDHATVVFELAESNLRVRSGQNPAVELFTAKPSVDQHGECRFSVTNEPLELWQISRRALEDLFFA